MSEASDGSTLHLDLAGLEPAPAPLEPLRPGQRYEIGRLLGQGGMGEVREALDRVLGVPVALKLLRADRAADAGLRARLLAEARVTARLGHPGLPRVFDIGIWADDRPYYTMSLYQGETLAARIRALHAGGSAADGAEGGSLTRLLALLAEACAAVGYAHALGVVHRDLKPQNLMIDPFEAVRVIDWGLWWAQDPELQAPEARGFLGTPAYASPEQRRGEGPPDPRWDVYALGATLYEIGVGRPPAPGASLARDAALPVDEALAELCAAALNADPARRPATAGALGEALRGWLARASGRARARALVREAEPILEDLRRAEVEERALREAAQAALNGLPAYAPVALKAPHWEALAQADALSEQASLQSVALMQRLRGALTQDPELPEAHARLADLYRADHERAEEAGDRAGATRAEALLRSHDRGRHARWLSGEGALTLITDPPGADVVARRFVERGRRLVLEGEIPLGTTPLRDVPLPHGSWMLLIRAPGRALVRYPVVIRRLERWDGIPPGGAEPWPIALPREEELGEDEVYVPAGWFAAGGDERAAESWPAGRRWVDSFVLKRFPVTNTEYLEFVAEAEARGELDPEWVPHLRPTGNEARGAPAWLRGEGGTTFAERTNEGVAQAELPVVWVSWLACDAFTRWRGARDGLPWRLPWEQEIEKAARGVDGRIFVTGRWLDPTWTRVRESSASGPSLSPVRKVTGDESPYGVCGMAGNARTWCLDTRQPDQRWTRGGAFSYLLISCRAAGRVWHDARTTTENLGLRLARAYGPQAIVARE